MYTKNMASKFGYSSLPNGGHGGLEYYNINPQTFIQIYRFSNLHLHSRIKKLILKHGTDISVAISSQDSHHHQINIYFQLLNVLGGVPSSSIKLDTYPSILFSKISPTVFIEGHKKRTFRPTCHQCKRRLHLVRRRRGCVLFQPRMENITISCVCGGKSHV